jgi:uncharacterized membrane protein
MTEWMTHKGFRYFIISILILGVFFRFVNLDRKVYWQDETITSLRISGHTLSETIQKVFAGRVIEIEELLKYQHINSQNKLADTINSLAVEDPQHPPLYYVMARFWAQWFGDSVAAVRSLSALISLLVFPSVYWLCLELFGSSLVGCIAVAIVAVSPFHTLFAQEARQYVLWAVTILISSASLLRARRLKTKLSWGIYAATVALGLYSFMFSGLVAIGHGIYLFVTEGFRITKTFIAYLLASIASLIAFLPWLLVFVSNWQQFKETTDWSQQQLPLLSLLKTVARQLSYVFFDMQAFSERQFFYYEQPTSYKQPLAISIFCVLLLTGYSIYFLSRHTPVRVWLFVLTLIGVTAAVVILPDIIFGGRRSSASRYFIPCYLGIQLAVAYLLATKISPLSANSWRQKLWQLVTVAVISSGVVSCTVSSQVHTAWNKDNSYFNAQVAGIVNQAHRPLVLSQSGAVGNVISLSYLLDPKVRLLLVKEIPGSQQKYPEIPDGYSDLFLFNPSQTSFDILKQEYSIVPALPLGKLWRLEKKNS